MKKKVCKKCGKPATEKKGTKIYECWLCEHCGFTNWLYEPKYYAKG